MTSPRYQDVGAKEIPEIIDDDGTRVRVITGSFWGQTGPVDGIAAEPLYLDISLPAGLRKALKVDTYRNTFAYIFEGSGKFADASDPQGVLLEKEVLGQELNIRDLSGNRTLVRFGTGDEIVVRAGPEGMRFLLVAGSPIREPVEWHGPTVMNTQEELHKLSLTCVTINLLNRKIIEVGKPMGLLQEGKWVDKWYDTKASMDILFESLRSFETGLRQTVAAGPTGSSGFKAEAGGITYMCL